MPDPARIKAIFTAALDRPEPERGPYLDGACGADALLRREVEDLLAGLAGRPVLDALTIHAEPPQRAAAAPRRSPGQALVEEPGSHISHYKLLEKIGEGGFGTVFMAEQERPVCRRVALKIIKLGMDTRQVIARFEAERQALAMMDHPHIAKVLDAGATDKGRPYFVMELVRGDPITEYCDRNNLAPAQRLDLFMQVCHAVQHAHQKGIIHRDIKPSNILVTIADGKPIPKVIDFGVAKATNARLTEKTLFTEHRQLIGTPAYMSPEQAEMSGVDIDTRSDIYSLGVLLYELLTGTTPFDARELLQAGYGEIQRIIREVEPQKPSTRLSSLKDTLASVAARRHTEPRRLSAIIRGDLDWIVMKCLEKDRTRRYETANGLALDVQRHLCGEPVVAAPPGTWYRARKFVRRNKGAVLAGGLVATALIIGIGVSTWMFLREREALARAVSAEQNQSRLRSQAEADEKTARIEAAKSQQVAQFLKDMLKGVGPSVALGRDTTMLREIVDQTAERIATDLKEQPEVQLELRQTLADVYHELGLYAQMEETARGTLDLARSSFGEENLPVANALGQVADALGHLSNYQEAVPLNRQAIAMQRRLRGADSVEEASALYHLSFGLVSQGLHSEAESTSRAALAMRRKLLGGEHPDVARSLDGLSVILRTEQKLAEAEATARESLAMRKKLLGEQHPELARSFAILGEVLKRERKYPEAEALLRQRLALDRKMLGEDSWGVADALGSLAGLLRESGNLAEAEDLYRQTLPIARKRMGDDHPWVAGYFRSLADVLRQEGKLADAEAVLREFLALQSRLPDDDQPHSVPVLAALADILRQNGNLAEARPLAEEAVAICLRNPEKVESWMQDRAFDALKNALTDLRDTAAADKLIREALPSFRQAVEADPQRSDSRIRLGHLLWQLGQVLRDTGRTDEAEEAFLEALQVFETAGKAFPAEPFLRQEEALSHRFLGQLMESLGRRDESERDYRAAVDLYAALTAANPQNPFYLIEESFTVWMVALVLDRAGRFDQAAEEFRHAAALHQKGIDAFPNEEAFKLRLISVRIGLAGLLLRMAKNNEGQDPGAEALLQEVITEAKLAGDADQLATAYAGAIRLLMNSQRQEEAKDLCRKLLALTPKNGQADNNVAWFLATAENPARRDPTLAVELAERAVELDPQAGNAWNTIGVARYRAGDFKRAVADLEKSVQLSNGGSSFDFFFLAMAHHQLGDTDAARRFYAQAITWMRMRQNSPQNEELLRFRGEAAELLGMEATQEPPRG